MEIFPKSSIPHPRFYKTDDHEDEAGPEGEAGEDAEGDGVGVWVFGEAHDCGEENDEERATAEEEEDEAEPEEAGGAEFGCVRHWFNDQFSGSVPLERILVPELFGTKADDGKRSACPTIELWVRKQAGRLFNAEVAEANGRDARSTERAASGAPALQSGFLLDIEFR